MSEDAAIALGKKFFSSAKPVIVDPLGCLVKVDLNLVVEVPILYIRAMRKHSSNRHPTPNSGGCTRHSDAWTEVLLDCPHQRRGSQGLLRMHPRCRSCCCY